MSPSLVTMLCTSQLMWSLNEMHYWLWVNHIPHSMIFARFEELLMSQWRHLNSASCTSRKYNSISSPTPLPECITYLMLFSNSQADDFQQVSLLVAASLSSENFSNEIMDDQFLAAVTYECFSSVIRQFDRHSISQNTNGNYIYVEEQ